MRNSSVSCGFVPALAGPALAAFALAGLFVPTFAFDTAEASERVGVAAAVTPDATSQPPGEAMRTLKIGKSVVYDERIDTSSSGVVQVLLLDGSTFTVGPGSSLVIDKFVYDPKSGKGSLVASFSKGALQIRRRQALQGGARHLGEDPCRRADRARRHVPGLHRRPQQGAHRLHLRQASLARARRSALHAERDRQAVRYFAARRAGHQARDLRRYQLPARRGLRQEDQISPPSK